MHIWMSCKMRTNIQFHVNHNLLTIQDDVFDEQLALRWSCMTRCPCIYEIFWEKTTYFGGKELLKMKGSLQINPWNILVQFKWNFLLGIIDLNSWRKPPHVGPSFGMMHQLSLHKHVRLCLFFILEWILCQ